MANEIHSLKIGDVEYPIYSEGIKVDSSVGEGASATSFLVAGGVAGGAGNRKIGISNAISGNSESLTISSDSIYLGKNSSKLLLGTDAQAVSLGLQASTVNIGYHATNVILGSSATNIGLGYNAQTVIIGPVATNVNLGEEATNVNLGKGKTTTAEDGTVTKHTTTKIGENNERVELGINSDNVIIGGGALTINIGSDSNNVTNGVYIGHNASDVDISGTCISIGNAGQSEITSNIYIESPHIYIDGMTTVYPEECTTTEMNTGFSVLRGDNAAVGVVFCAPSLAKGGMLILPKNAYNSTANVVSLGTTTKRFGAVYVTMGKATNGFTTDSDERLKDFGDDIAVDLDALAALRKSYYRWNETSGFENEKDRMLGISAQEVQKIYPELVDADENGMLSMAYDRLSVVALAAIDKLHETNKELKSENAELKDRIANLENLVDTILSRIN